MTIDSFVRELEDALGKIALGKIKPEVKFRELPWWDSMSTLTAMTVFDSFFHTQLSAKEMDACTTIRDIFAVGERALRR